jgi:hypothetical protein
MGDHRLGLVDLKARDGRPTLELADLEARA